MMDHDDAMVIFCWGNEPDRRPVRVLVRRPMLLHRHGEAAPRHADAGEVVTTERHLLGKLTGGDFEIVGTPADPIDDHRDR